MIWRRVGYPDVEVDVVGGDLEPLRGGRCYIAIPGIPGSLSVPASEVAAPSPAPPPTPPPPAPAPAPVPEPASAVEPVLAAVPPRSEPTPSPAESRWIRRGKKRDK